MVLASHIVYSILRAHVLGPLRAYLSGQATEVVQYGLYLSIAQCRWLHRDQARYSRPFTGDVDDLAFLHVSQDLTCMFFQFLYAYSSHISPTPIYQLIYVTKGPVPL